MKYKATKQFKELGIENDYQGLTVENYFALRRGEIIEIDNLPIKLKDFVEEIKTKGKVQ